MFIVGGNGHACLMAVQSWTLFLKTDFSEVSGTVNHSWCCLSGCGCSRQLQRSWKGLSSWEGQAGSFRSGLWTCSGFGLALALDLPRLWTCSGFGLAPALDLPRFLTWPQYSLKSMSYEEMSYEKKKNGQTVISDDLSALAPQVGLEPTTPLLTVRFSNRLSYWGILSTFSVVCSFRECKGTTKID